MTEQQPPGQQVEDDGDSPKFIEASSRPPGRPAQQWVEWWRALHRQSWDLEGHRTQPGRKLSPWVVLAVAGALAQRMKSDPKGAKCYPSIETLAKESRLSRRTVLDGIGALEWLGWLRVKRDETPDGRKLRGATRSNCYLACFPAGQQVTQAEPEEVEPENVETEEVVPELTAEEVPEAIGRRLHQCVVSGGCVDRDACALEPECPFAASARELERLHLDAGGS